MSQLLLKAVVLASSRIKQSPSGTGIRMYGGPAHMHTCLRLIKMGPVFGTAGQAVAACCTHPKGKEAMLAYPRHNQAIQTWYRPADHHFHTKSGVLRLSSQSCLPCPVPYHPRYELGKRAPIVPMVTKADTMTIREAMTYRSEVANRIANPMVPGVWMGVSAGAGGCIMQCVGGSGFGCLKGMAVIGLVSSIATLLPHAC